MGGQMSAEERDIARLNVVLRDIERNLPQMQEQAKKDTAELKKTLIKEGRMEPENMAGEWQLDAVHKQLDVFESLSNPFKEIPSTDLRQLLEEVSSIQRKHLHVKENNAVSIRKIAGEILKNSEDSERIKISFVIVVTDIVVEDELCKIPIFKIKYGDKSIFIDMNCNVYQNWDSFMKRNDLPACNMCYPVNGCYNVEEKLMINFAPSPRSYSVSSSRDFVSGILITSASAALSWFLKISPQLFKAASWLIDIAETSFSPKIIVTARLSLALASSIQMKTRGSLSSTEFLTEAFNILKQLFNLYDNAIDHAMNKVMHWTRQAYDYVYKKVFTLYRFVSDTARYVFFAIVTNVKNSITFIKENAETRLRALWADEDHEPVCPNPEVESVSIECVIGSAPQEPEKKNESVQSDLFKDCKEVAALDSGVNKKLDCVIDQDIEYLLEISHGQTKKSGNDTFDQMQDTFESLSQIVIEEFEEKIKCYEKQARVAKKMGMSKNKLHSILMIHGNAVTHYWRETVKDIEKFKIAAKIKECMKDTSKKKKITLIPTYTESADSMQGTYKLIGIPGAGDISTQSLLKVVKEEYTKRGKQDVVKSLNENDAVINQSYRGGTYIKCDSLIIVAYTQVSKEKTSEGVVFIKEIV